MNDKKQAENMEPPVENDSSQEKGLISSEDVLAVISGDQVALVEQMERAKEAALAQKNNAQELAAEKAKKKLEEEEKKKQAVMDEVRRRKEESLRREQLAREEAERKIAEAEAERQRQLAEKKRLEEEARLKAEQERLEAERIRREKEETIKAKEEAKRAKEQARIDAKKAKLEAKEAARREKIEAREKAKQDKLQAIENAKKAREEAKRAKEAAREKAKQDKLQAIENAKKAREEAKRAKEAAREKAKQDKLQAIENAKKAREEAKRAKEEARERAKQDKLQAMQNTNKVNTASQDVIVQTPPKEDVGQKQPVPISINGAQISSSSNPVAHPSVVSSPNVLQPLQNTVSSSTDMTSIPTHTVNGVSDSTEVLTTQKSVDNHVQKEKTQQVKKESNLKYYMTFIFLTLLIWMVAFLPDISSFVSDYFASRRQTAIPKITTGVLTCTMSTSDDKYDHYYTAEFSFEDSKMYRFNFKSTTKGDQKLDALELSNMKSSCDLLKQQTINLEGVDVSCSLSNGVYENIQKFNYQKLKADEVTTAYLEAGGTYPNYKYEQHIDEIEKQMKASNYTCERHS